MVITNPQDVYALLSANVYGVTNNDSDGRPRVRSSLNTIPLPGPEWSIIAEQASDATGFMARAYRNVAISS